MSNSFSLGKCACLFILGWTAAGCSLGNSDMPDLGQVAGDVTLDGNPLSNAMITFQPESGRPSIGTTNAQGHFQLDYMANQPGAKLGVHKVIIRKEVETKSRQGETIYKETLSPQYNRNSTLTAEVEEGSNTFAFDLSSQP